MAASSVYQSTHLSPGGDIVGPERFKVAGLLYAVQEQIRNGMAAATAVAYVTAQPRTNKILLDAQRRNGMNTAIVTDFAAISAL